MLLWVDLNGCWNLGLFVLEIVDEHASWADLTLRISFGTVLLHGRFETHFLGMMDVS